MTKRKIDYWVIPPEADGEFVANMEEPLSGWRQVTVRERRTKIDWAGEVEELLRTRYASAEKVILVCDNLNTHTKGLSMKRLSRRRQGKSSVGWSFATRPNMAVG